MSLFDYSSSSMYEILIWAIDIHGFVQVEKVHLEL